MELQRSEHLPEDPDRDDTMFSKDLLVTRKRRPYITPVFIHPEETGLAEKIIKIYEKGKTKGEIDEQTLKLETYANFRVVRGLSELMRRRTTFEQSFSAEPYKVRTYLYEKGYIINQKERADLLLRASNEFGIPVEDIESSFWADREDYQIISSIDEPSGLDLVRYYNLSLAQTLLFDAISLEVSTSGNYQEIFRTIKYLGLMYEIQSDASDLITMRVTGPASLFKKTRKYGTSLAKLLPKIMKAPFWKIKAQIETEVAGEPRIYIFELSDSKKELFPDVINEKEEHFDSTVEENFVKRFSSVRKDWVIKREPTVLKAGPSVMIPDFSLERRGKRCYIEIVGFWTPEYLKKKTEKVKALNQEIILCVSKELQCTKRDFQKKGIDVIFYDKEVPLKPVLERIRKMESEQVEEEKKELSNVEITLTGDIVSLEDVAQMYHVGLDSVKKALEENEEGVVVGDKFVKNFVLEEIEKRLEGLEDMRLSSVKNVLHEYNLDEKVLRKVGFDIEWKTLDAKNAVVRKRESAK